MTTLLQCFDAVRKGLQRGARLLLVSDFDGTLSPIVSSPEAAVLPPLARCALEQLGNHADVTVAIISGRPMRDVRARVGLPALVYGGCHGLEIEGPAIHYLHPAAPDFAAFLARIIADVRECCEDMPDVLVEDKGLGLALHTWGLDDTQSRVLRGRLELVAATGSGVARLQSGKNLLELVPAVEWNKGCAARMLLDLEQEDCGEVVTLCLGDDVTDESLFSALGAHGSCVLVGSGHGQPTLAQHRLPDVEVAAALLACLASFVADVWTPGGRTKAERQP